MLIGEYSSKIGKKKRVSIPKKLRSELGSEVILTRGYENALVMVNKVLWKNIAGDIIDGSFINKNVRDTSRFLIGSAVEVSADKQGRIVVPDSLHEYADFDNEVVFVGLVNWIELWDKGKWEKRVQYLSQNSDKIAEELNNMANSTQTDE